MTNEEKKVLLQVLTQLIASDEKTPTQKGAHDPPIGEYVIIRGSAAGCHAGELLWLDNATKSCGLKNARRLWRYQGCETLSELAVYGASEPEECRFAPVVEYQGIVNDACEVIVCQPAGRKMIESCPEWVKK